ncbi:hypothetical protein K469DRAFT_689590 [Zopfia rhizophila CBS 207.26]|uniref:Uncharacterized protein n=1 Tax=Zopfia rhizophila CBS 207.26 TaxID=1314779 RepID=A0A6A6DZV4_9PEZI|nr:hypothetical protein K469DRAFT_689590 [Zopfia rhizophila CBS 207.26]
MNREHDRSSSSNSELTECPNQDVLPPSADYIYDIFANPSEQSVYDKHRVQDPDRTTSPIPTEVASDSLYTSYLINIERGSVSSSSRKEDWSNMSQPEALQLRQIRLRKRCGMSAGPHAPLTKRPRRSARAKEAEKTSVHLGSRGQKTLCHAFLFHYRDKDWRVDDLDDVYLAEDGSMQCAMRWEQSVVAESDSLAKRCLSDARNYSRRSTERRSGKSGLRSRTRKLFQTFPTQTTVTAHAPVATSGFWPQTTWLSGWCQRNL